MAVRYEAEFSGDSWVVTKFDPDSDDPGEIVGLYRFKEDADFVVDQLTEAEATS